MNYVGLTVFLGSAPIRFWFNEAMSVIGTKQTFSDRNRNDRFRVLSGSSVRQCLLLEMERTLTLAIGHGGF